MTPETGRPHTALAFLLRRAAKILKTHPCEVVGLEQTCREASEALALFPDLVAALERARGRLVVLTAITANDDSYDALDLLQDADLVAIDAALLKARSAHPLAESDVLECRSCDRPIDRQREDYPYCDDCIGNNLDSDNDGIEVAPPLATDG